MCKCPSYRIQVIFLLFLVVLATISPANAAPQKKNKDITQGYGTLDRPKIREEVKYLLKTYPDVGSKQDLLTEIIFLTRSLDRLGKDVDFLMDLSRKEHYERKVSGLTLGSTNEIQAIKYRLDELEQRISNISYTLSVIERKLR